MKLETLSLKDVIPDPNNPRKDFGDLEALAATFALNPERPGEPVNPPIVVKDGSRYRIVDGERRHRAMEGAGKDQATYMVCDGLDEASTMVTMMATDDKQRLTDDEKSRGIQQMLILGVDDEVVERLGSLGSGKAKVAKVGLRAAKKKADQMEIGQLIAIGEAEERGDKEAAKAIREAKGYRYAIVAREYEILRKLEQTYTLVADACDGAGVELRSKKRSRSIFQNNLWNPADMSEDKVREWLTAEIKAGRDIVMAIPELGDYSNSLESYDPPQQLTDAEAAAKSTQNKAKSAMTEAKRRRAQWVFDRLGEPDKMKATLAFFATEEVLGRVYLYTFCDIIKIDRKDIPLSSCPLSIVEHWVYVDDMTQNMLLALMFGREDPSGSISYQGKLSESRKMIHFLDALKADGYELDEHETELYNVCKRIASKKKSA